MAGFAPTQALNGLAEHSHVTNYDTTRTVSSRMRRKLLNRLVGAWGFETCNVIARLLRCIHIN